MNTEASPTSPSPMRVDHAADFAAPMDDTALRARLRGAGLDLLTVDITGRIVGPTCCVQTETSCEGADEIATDWLLRMLCVSPRFRKAFGVACERWALESEPATTEVLPGLWLAPMPLTSRRRRVGYAVAVIPTMAFAGHLAAMCDECGADGSGGGGNARACSRRRAAVSAWLAADAREGSCAGPADTRDVPRLAALARCLHEDHQRLTTSGQQIDSVGRQLAESYEEMHLLFSITQNMTVQERPERFVALACQELHATLSYAWVGVQFGQNALARGKLKALAGRLIVAGDPPTNAVVMREHASELLERALPGEPLVLDTHAQEEDRPFAPLGRTVVAHPICSDHQVIALLIAGEKRGPDTTASSVDAKLIGATASHVGIFLENAALYDDLNAMFLGTLEALTASIDAKDRYTCGHSRRVAHLTMQLARAMGLDEHTVSRCHIAGLVHDVGKIGVPETVLLKPGKLNAVEFEWIRRHPEMGYRILKDIPQLADILPGVLHHHERWDGGGYPEGLAGERIPLLARLIALADSFDAMSSTRTYRSAMSRTQVLDEIARCAGLQFDPLLARTFVGLDFAEFDRLVAEHQALEFGDASVGAVARSLGSIRREEAA